jgi:hypothetical protein
MKDSDMLEQNRRDILRHLHFTGLAEAWDKIDPLPTQSGRSTIRINVDEAFAGQRLEWIEQPEASNPTQPNASYSGDSEAMAMSLVGRGQETRPNARESAFGDDAWTGYEPSNWAWPDVVGTGGEVRCFPKAYPELGDLISQIRRDLNASGHGEACSVLFSDSEQRDKAIGAEPLLSRASCVEVEPEQFIVETDRYALTRIPTKQDLLEIDRLKPASRAVFDTLLAIVDDNNYVEGRVGKGVHRFIYLDGSERKERAAQ